MSTLTLTITRDAEEFDVEVRYKIRDASFAHAFGTERALEFDLLGAAREDDGEEVQLTPAEQRDAEDRAWSDFVD